jgi:hypothetical protein
MNTIEDRRQDRHEDLLFAVGLCLVVAVVLVIVAAVLRATSDPFSQFSARNQIELVSEAAANISIAALVLGAVVALSFLSTERIVSARPLVVVVLIVGTVIALLATYSVVDIFTMHVPGGNSADVFTVTNAQGSFASRLSSALPQIGSGFIAIVALVGATRIGNDA